MEEQERLLLQQQQQVFLWPTSVRPFRPPRVARFVTVGGWGGGEHLVALCKELGN